MKIMKCDLCEATADGEIFEVWMQALMPHYMQAHADVIKGKAGLSDEERRVEMHTWMAENRARFETA